MKNEGQSERITVQDIVQCIIEMIHNGEFLPGMPLREADLCKRFGVSRTPIREAFRLLQNNGVVEYIPRCGVQVVELTMENLNYITDLRTVLEILSVEKALPNFTKEDIDALREINKKFSEAESDGERSLFDKELHQYIARKSGSPLILKYLTELHIRQALFWCWIPFRSGRAIYSVQEHENIIKAIEWKDMALAKQQTEVHFRLSQRSLQRKLAAYKRGETL